jgi:nitronate monooxygenase
MQIQTRLCKLLGIQFPIIQAPIGSAVSPELVAAVSNSGGLGCHAFSWKTSEEIVHYISATQRLTQQSFCVNFVLVWSQLDRLKLCLDAGIRIFSFSWGDASNYIQTVHEYGGIALVTVGSSDEAKKAIEQGADVIVAQGWESGGHVLGQISGLTLIPKVVDTVHPIPVVAAGGIADGRGLVAAMALGAGGIWIGTRFLASREAIAHQIYKQRILEAQETDTTYSSLFDGGWENAPHRTIRNSTIIEWERAKSPKSGQRPHEGEIIGESLTGACIKRYDDTIPLEETTGDLEAMALYAGQSLGLIEGILPAAEIIQQIINDAQRVAAKLVVR